MVSSRAEREKIEKVKEILRVFNRRVERYLKTYERNNKDRFELREGLAVLLLARSLGLLRGIQSLVGVSQYSSRILFRSLSEVLIDCTYIVLNKKGNDLAVCYAIFEQYERFKLEIDSAIHIAEGGFPNRKGQCTNVVQYALDIYEKYQKHIDFFLKKPQRVQQLVDELEKGLIDSNIELKTLQALSSQLKKVNNWREQHIELNHFQLLHDLLIEKGFSCDLNSMRLKHFKRGHIFVHNSPIANAFFIEKNRPRISRSIDEHYDNELLCMLFEVFVLIEHLLSELGIVSDRQADMLSDDCSVELMDLLSSLKPELILNL